MKVNSIRFEISVLYTIVLGVILFVFSIVLFVIFHAFYVDLDRQLTLKASEISHTMRTYLDVYSENPQAMSVAANKTVSLKAETPFKIASSRISKKWLERAEELDLSRDYIHVLSADKADSLARSKNLSDELHAIFMDNAQLSKDGGIFVKRINHKGTSIRLINYPFVDKQGHEYIIQVGVLPGQITFLVQNWLYSIAIIIPIVLWLTSFMGRLIASRILNPVEEITAMAQKITHEDLSTRVKAKHLDEEMQMLVEAFNDMISRLEKSFKHIEDFSAHVAHELKTPLTIIRGETELGLKKPRDSKEYERVLSVVLDESERMLKTIEDLLLLTRLNYQPDVFQFKRTDFVEFFKEVGQQAQMLASAKNIKVQVELPAKPMMISADTLHLRRLFFNLIDNAIKFTSEGGKIYLSVKQAGHSLIASVRDTGAGIPEAEIPKIFDRFYSGDQSPSGSGLGLSIAQSIAKIHQGKITVTSKLKDGTIFFVELPMVVNHFFKIPAVFDAAQASN